MKLLMGLLQVEKTFSADDLTRTNLSHNNMAVLPTVCPAWYPLSPLLYFSEALPLAKWYMKVKLEALSA